MRTALVTGATGYVGRALFARLLADGIAAHALVRLTSNLERLHRIASGAACHAHDGTTESIGRIVAEIAPDVVFHLATCYRRDDVSAEVEELVRANLLFGTQILDAVRRSACRRIVVAGSYFEHYGESADQAFNLYAATKRAFGEILAYHAEVAGIDAALVTLYDVYGPDDERRRLPAAMRDAQHGGRPLPLPSRPINVDMVFVDDATEALCRAAALTAEGRRGVRRFAASSGKAQPIGDVVAAFERASGKAVPVAPGAYRIPARAIETPWRGAPVPGWVPRISLEEGFRRLLGRGGGS